MRNLFVAAILSLIGISAFGQSLTDVNKYYFLKKYEDAKKEIDKVMADPKAQAKADFWVTKANIYASLYSDDALRAKYPDAGAVSLQAIEKAKQLDPTFKAIKDNNGLTAVGALYSISFNDGRKYFSESKWDEAFKSFQVAEDLGNFITVNGWAVNPQQKIDTFTVLYTGYAAQNAKKPEEAVKYYTKIINQKVGGKDLVDVYRFMLNYQMEQKNREAFTKYLGLAREVYPDSASLWTEYEMEYMSKNSSLDQVVDQFTKGDQAGNLSAEQYSGLGQAIAGGVFKADSAKQSELRLKAADAFKKAYDKGQSGLDAYNAGVMYYNEFANLDERFSNLRGTAADLKVKREQVEKLQYPLADQSINWMEKAYTTLKAKSTLERVEKSCLNKSVDFLANLYLWKRDKARGKDPKGYDAFDAKYKQFDSEHGKYQ
ncbi:MAG: tetratricopeptide repeat domain protein [Chitinophagaceae bacterium]|nr:tetratricopeptide repeat domain protein [Chitinophagaceae bacterium]